MEHTNGARILLRNLPLVWLLALASVGCATQVTPLGPNRYMARKQGASVYATPSSVKAAAMQGAAEYCAAKPGGMVAVAEDVETGVDWRDVPNAEVIFKCLANAAKPF